MRRVDAVLINSLGTVAALLFLAPSAFAAEDPTCASYRNAWERARNDGNTAEMRQLKGPISQACAALSVEVTKVLRDIDAAEAQRRADEAARERQAVLEANELAEANAWKIAKSGNTIEGYDAFLSAYPSGANRQNALEAKSVLIDAAKPYALHVCNTSGEIIYMSIFYKPVGETTNYRYVGWYKLNNSECHDVTTSNPYFYVYAKDGSNQDIWSGDSAKCMAETDTFDFLKVPGPAPCPSGTVSKNAIEIKASSKDYTHNLNK